MARRMKDVLLQRASEGFVGRAEELCILLNALDQGGPSVVFVHGIGGIGKSSLLDAFATQARAGGTTVLRLDCRTIEPSQPGFLHELGLATGGDATTVEEAADRLGSLGSRVVLALDAYEVFRFMDTWLRQVFVPALGENVRLVLSGREAPVVAWLSAWGSQGLLRSVRLGPLEEREAAEVLRRAGIGEGQVARISRLARGHPLALKLAAAALTERPDLTIDEVAAQRVVAELTRIYLEEVRDPLTRETLEAASVVRRTTHSLLRAMLPHAAPQDAYERLQALPFVESSRDGLVLHDLVQEAVAAALRSADPSRHHAYRLTAYRQLCVELRAASRADLWRYTADLLFMCENLLIREAFFPSSAHVYEMEAARPTDGPAIEAIIARHEGARMAQLLTGWWSREPRLFRVVRDREGVVAGFYAAFDPTTVPATRFLTDPLFGRWWSHLKTVPVAKHECVLFTLRWLSRDEGESPSTVQAACWLDIKAGYMQLRPNLRRIYMVVRDMEGYGPVAQQLGFRPILDGPVELDGVSYHSAMLDFGPSSIDGWLMGMVAAELGADEEGLLDRDAQELVVGGQRVGLTPLEFKVMDYLSGHAGKVVTRASFLADVWGYDYDGGSNVVDAVVRSLRKKLGARASEIETVTGAGYRLRGG
jgi:Transcriptional regulatory protein, C terminal/AAA ATPase domain